MPSINEYLSITSDLNFLNIDLGSQLTFASGFYEFGYNFLDDKNDLSAANGYDIVTAGESPSDTYAQNMEYYTFAETNSYQKSIFSIVMGVASGYDYEYSVFFKDVVGNITFVNEAANLADINIGQVSIDLDGDGTSDDATAAAYMIDGYNSLSGSIDPGYAYSTVYNASSDRAHGDIWLNAELDAGFTSGWGATASGTYQFETILHELGHALGLSHVDGSDIDNQKYSIMSYNYMSGMVVPDNFATPFANETDVFFPSGLQIYDILSLQQIYSSRNNNIRDDDTAYESGQGLNSNVENAFIYAIWDGGGQDKIDASAYADGVFIDLRQGHFSSIGKAYWDDYNGSRGEGLADDNVSIAFYTVIEESKGTAEGDTLIGNAWDNKVWGGDGEDKLYGDGTVYDTDAGYHAADPFSGSNNIAADSDDSGSDELYGEAGDDDLFGGAGADLLDGGTDNDTAHYENTTRTPSDVSGAITGIVPTQNYINVLVGNYASEGADFKVIDRYGDIDKLIFIEKIIAEEAGLAQNRIDLVGNQELKIKSNFFDSENGSFEWNGKIYGFENFNNVRGDSGNQEVLIQTHGFEFRMGAGDDKVVVSGDANTVYLGDGEDTVYLQVRSGNDAYIMDADANDVFKAFGAEQTGSFKWSGSESAWSQRVGSVAFSVNQIQDLVIKTALTGTVFVANYVSDLVGDDSTAGIKLYELDMGAWLFFREKPPEWFNGLTTGFQQALFHVKEVAHNANPGYDPLVLDLDGDGIELTTLTTFAPQFDLTADGFAERTGWVDGDDGLLALDLNSNGKIDDITELFGSRTESGLAALADLDSNTDGVIDENDTDFDDLRVWRDLDQDGVTDVGELKTLAESGIESFNLTPVSTTPTTQAGNTIAATGTFTRTDTTTGTMGDVLFDVNGFDTKFLDSVTVTVGAAAQPNLKGHGTIADLHQAMSIDADLIDTLETVLPTLNTPDLATLRTNLMPLLIDWMATVSVPVGSPGTQARIDVPIKITTDPVHGPQILDFGIEKHDGLGSYWVLASGDDIVDEFNAVIARPDREDVMAQSGTWSEMDGQLISFMERWLGLHIPLGLDGGETGEDAIEGAMSIANIMWQQMHSLAARLASEGGLSDYFEGIAYDTGSDKFIPTTDRQLIPMMEAIFDAAPGTSGGDATHLANWKPLIDVVLNDFDRPGDLQISYGYLFQNVVAAYENLPLAISLTDAAVAFSIPSDQIIIGAGTGTTTGTEDNDLIYLGTGDQRAEGGDGPDSYIIGKDFGQIEIYDFEDTLGEDKLDSIRFAHLASTDVTLTRENSDLIISVNGTSDVLRVEAEFVARIPGLLGGYINPAYGISEFIFSDGVVWDRVDVAQMSSHALSSNDIIYGTGQVDFLDGGTGNDHLSGGNEGDIYVFGLGYGTDVVSEVDTDFATANTDAYLYGYSLLIETPDIVNLKDLTQSDVTFVRLSENDLRITVDGETDSLTITNQFNASYTGVFGTQWFDRIEYFAFSDGDDLSAEDLMIKMVADAKTSGNDTIMGFSYEDTLDGGAGDDLLTGLNEGDTYLFGRGSGHDTIFEGEPASTLSTGDNIDRLVFADDVLTTDIVIERGPGIDDLKLIISDTGDSVVLQDQATEFVLGDNFYEIEEIVFADSTVWDTNDMQQMYLDTAATSGNNTIIGFMRNDTLDGLAGNDRLEGRGGSDTYNFGASFGQDVVYDYPELTTWNTADTIHFGGSWVQASFSYTKTGNDLVIQSLSSSDKVTVEDFFALSLYRIENFTFSDSSTLTDSDMYTLAVGGTLIIGTSAGETLTGNAGHNRIEGRAGNDTINGGDGNDVLFGEDGNDNLNGGNDNDTYIAGPGNDVIDEQSGTDVIEFESGVSLGDLTFYRTYNGLVDQHLFIQWGGNTIKIAHQFQDSGTGERVESILFSDSSTLDLINRSYETRGTSLGETIYGEASSGFGQNDVIYAYAGNDTIWAQGGNDTIDGGDGNDYIRGEAGNDTYIHSSGNDIYEDAMQSTSNSGTDTIQFESGITLSSLTMYRQNDFDLIIEVSDGSKITVVNQFWGANAQVIESLTFYGGSTFTFSTSNQIQVRGTSGNDNIDGDVVYASVNDLIYGYAGNDIIDGNTGNDTIYGGADTDTIHGNAGNDLLYGDDGNDILYGDDGDDQIWGGLGNDTINGNNNADTIDGGDGTDTITGGSGNDTIAGSDGVDTLNGNAGNDTITGGLGNDLIYGEDGDDNLSGGDGDDIIYETYSGTDTIDGGAGTDTLDYSDMASYRLTVNLLTGTQSDNRGTPSNDTISNIENIVGSANQDSITGSNVANVLSGGNGNDTIYGKDGNDTIKGDAGTDTLYGENGNDVIYGGSGLDTMYGGANLDTFVFEAASAYSNIDVIKDFSLSDNDRINLHDLLGDYDPLTELITDFVQITTSGANSILKIDRDGTGSTYSLTQVATIEGITGLTDEAALVTSGNLVV